MNIIGWCEGEEKHLKRQTDALDQLYKQIYSAKSEIDSTDFDTISLDDDDEEEEIQSVDERRGSKEKDRIERLPGQPRGVKFAQYGGYVTVDANAGRSLFYYFVEANNNKEKSKLPLLLWLNGGPGCSSLGYGAMQELGPFRVHSDGRTLYPNKFAWNNVANVIFLETPAGVGYSYSNRTSDYSKSGDKRTAKDNFKFLVKWLERFPEYKGREFYISGESYAGHYVPQFAHTILSHNNKSRNPHINLKGIAIGNAAIDDESDNLGMYDYFGNHALISPETNEQIQKECNFTPEGQKNLSRECTEARNKADNDVANIDIYNIYYPLCRTSKLTRKPKKASLVNFDPCSDYYVHAYLNRAQVQEAMHANVTKLDHDWQPCSDVIRSWNYNSISSLSLLRDFMDNGLRVLVYSGDIDGRVPVTSTQYALKKLNLTTLTEWYPWFLNGQVGGYAEIYKRNLTFATVRGAGHEVPSYQPERSLALIKYFLSGKSLPTRLNRT
ncbi:serine carboxypeptidase-like 40 [Euphorbia peplus]|nr:serine carboxypeptidase-like 40 [Euphorbia peplus]